MYLCAFVWVAPYKLFGCERLDFIFSAYRLLHFGALDRIHQHPVRLVYSRIQPRDSADQQAKENSWSFNDWKKTPSLQQIHFRIGSAQSFRFAGTSRCTSGRGTRIPRIFGQLPSIPWWASIQADPSPVPIWVIIAKYSLHQPFAILPFSEATS